MRRYLAAIMSITLFAVVGLTSAQTSRAGAPATAQRSAAHAASQAHSRVHAHVRGTTANGGILRGRFTPTHFVKRPGRIVAIGNLTGTLTRANGNKAHIDRTIRLPLHNVNFVGRHASKAASTAANSQFRAAAMAPGSCRIVNLVLGPLNLNVLGLVIHLNRVHLNITAHTGPGNLVGNLLCAVAGLLDGVSLSGLLGRVATLLNRVLRAVNTG
jgi:hypothetical protein